jgi:hypothetical protein
MSTIIPFLPSNTKVPSFMVVLDGRNYNISVTWNVSAQRYYINLSDMKGDWITTVPLITTPPGEPIASFTYDPLQGLATVVKQYGHRQRAGTIIRYTLMGFMPTSLNGTIRGLTLDDVTFSYPMVVNPGLVIRLGSVHRILDMVAGLFQRSTLCYRNGAFEVNP